jgi:protein-S-isoprenylcysteine O-methyltransferase Ste14
VTYFWWGAMNKFTEIREKTANLLVASFYGYFVYIYGAQLVAGFRLSLLLMVIKETLDVSFYLCRKMPTHVSFRLASWIMAICGTLAPLLLRPAPSTDSGVGKIIQIVGCFLQVAAIVSLNRSFGIVPAIRDIKVNGMYRLVRHPLYLAYSITLSGFVISNITPLNIIILLLAISFQVVRISREEEILSQDEGYIRYVKGTKWKMVPFIY